MSLQTKKHWYTTGLYFQCNQCGQCCSGPGEGYVWVTGAEIELIADYLKITTNQLRRRYIRRVGFRTSLIEHPVTKDCIFLERNGNRKYCKIYKVRPNQCRTWPFWPSNLTSIDSWNQAARKCCGINRGRFYSYEQIEKIRKSKHWWLNESNPDNQPDDKSDL